MEQNLCVLSNICIFKIKYEMKYDALWTRIIFKHVMIIFERLNMTLKRIY